MATKPDRNQHHAAEQPRKTSPEKRPQAPVHPDDRDESKEGLVGGKYGQQNPQLRPSGEAQPRISPIDDERGAIGYIVLWLLGVPAGLLFIVFLMRGCT